MSTFATGEQEQAYIEQAAAAAGLDTKAVLAVAAHEGVSLPAEVGDNGTSFGPWQLHAGGALPKEIWQQGPDYANAWANSAAGIDYALAGIRKAVGSQTSGAAAIRAIVYNFEKPKDPGSETVLAEQTYLQGAGPSVDQAGVNAAGLGVPGTQQTQGTTSIPNYTPGSSTTSPVSITSSLFGGVENAFFRGGEIILGVILIGMSLAGIYLALAKGKTSPLALIQAPTAGAATGVKKQVAGHRERQQVKAQTVKREATAARKEQRTEEIHTQRVQVGRANVRTARAKARREEGSRPKVARKPATVQLEADKKPVRAQRPVSAQTEEIPF